MVYKNYDFRGFITRFNDLTLYNIASIRERTDEVARLVIGLLQGNVGTEIPDAPDNVSAVGGTLQISLTWDAVTDADSYKIYGSDDGVTFAEIGEVQTTSFIEYVDSGTTRYYYATTIEDQRESVPSGVASATATAGTPGGSPTQPTGFTNSALSSASATFTWDTLTGDNVGVVIEKSRDNSLWADAGYGVGGVETWKDTVVLQGFTYYYRLRAFNNQGTRSAPTSPSLTVQIPGMDVDPPPVPVLTTVTAGDEAVQVEWTGVTAPGLAGYQVGFAATPTGGSYALYTVNSNTVWTSNTITLGSLTNSTEYGFAVRSIDTSGAFSAWSNEITATPTDVLGDVTPPSAPTGVRGESTSVNQVTLYWDANTEPDLARYRVYRADFGSTTLTEVSGAGVFAGKETFEDTTPTTGEYSYWVTAEDATGNESAYSDRVVETADGNDLIPGEGGGPQEIPGDGGLGSTHKAPGYTFQYVIDISDGSLYPNTSAFRQACGIFNNRINRDPNDPLFIDLSVAPTIAILMPERTENESIVMNASTVYPNGNRMDWQIHGADCNIHFIAPWGTDTFADSKATAMVKARDRTDMDYKYNLQNLNTITGESNLTHEGGALIRMDWGRHGFVGEVHFWCMSLLAGGREVVALGQNLSMNGWRGAVDIHFHICEMHQDNLSMPLVPQSGGNNIRAYTFWGISTWGKRLHLHGFYADLPYNSEHFVYTREEGYGDTTYEYVSVDRCGGQLLQMAQRWNLANGFPNQWGVFMNPTSPGTVTLTGWRCATRPGRWLTKQSAFLALYNTHKGLTIDDCHFVELLATDTRINWPPRAPYSDDIREGPHYESEGCLQFTLDGGSIATGTPAQVGSWVGYQSGPLQINDSLFWTKRIAKPIMGMDNSPDIDVTNTGIFQGSTPGSEIFQGNTEYGPGSQNNVDVATRAENAARVTAAYWIGAFNWSGNCTAAQITELEGTYGVPSGESEIPGIKLGTDRDTIATGDQTISFTNFRGAYEAGVNPSDLSVT